MWEVRRANRSGLPRKSTTSGLGGGLGTYNFDQRLSLLFSQATAGLWRCRREVWPQVSARARISLIQSAAGKVAILSPFFPTAQPQIAWGGAPEVPPYHSSASSTCTLAAGECPQLERVQTDNGIETTSGAQPGPVQPMQIHKSTGCCGRGAEVVEVGVDRGQEMYIASNPKRRARKY